MPSYSREESSEEKSGQERVGLEIGGQYISSVSNGKTVQIKTGLAKVSYATGLKYGPAIG